MHMDHSTLNLVEIARLPVAQIRQRHYIDQSVGSACFGDPPGYPSYFVSHVYTQGGNEPRAAGHPTDVLRLDYCDVEDKQFRVLRTIEGPWDDAFGALLRSLYLPLPLDHERVQAWIIDKFRHHKHHYVHPSKTDKNCQDRPASFFWSRETGLATHSYDVFANNERPLYERSVPDWIVEVEAETHKRLVAVEKERVRKARATLNDDTAKLATPENHFAVRYVRRWYPDFEPTEALIHDPPASVGMWWETEAEQPTPETCEPRSCGPHPVNKTWCQWCGWREENDDAG